MNFAPKEAQGLAYIPSMAVGVLLTAPLLTVAFIALGHTSFNLHLKAAAIPGILAGVVWNAGNVRCSTHQSILFKDACMLYTGRVHSFNVQTENFFICLLQVFSIIATTNPNIGLSIAYPVMQVCSASTMIIQSNLVQAFGYLLFAFV